MKRLRLSIAFAVAALLTASCGDPGNVRVSTGVSVYHGYGYGPGWYGGWHHRPYRPRPPHGPGYRPPNRPVQLPTTRPVPRPTPRPMPRG
ncbi:MAG: hypothetical protein AAGE01_11570 [Pseudomonadota bacterium]